jgi:phosphohistidine phosphatase
VRVFLVRHAEAAPGAPDELRPLTPHGHDQARALGAQLRRDVPVDAVVSSPLLRARQTAEAIAQALDLEAEATDLLAPGATEADVRAAVEGRGATVIAVGHQPDCGKIAAALGDGVEPPFPPAGFARLDLPA